MRQRLLLVAAFSVALLAGTRTWAADTEAAPSSKVSGTSFGAVPDRDLRQPVVAASADYLGQLARQSDANAKVSDVEVLAWRSAIKPAAVDAYQKMAIANLAKAGYAYKITSQQNANGQALTYFSAESAAGKIIGYWQATPQGMFLHWGRLGGAAAPPPPPAPPALPAPAAKPQAAMTGDAARQAEIAELERRLAELKGTPPAVAPNVPATPNAAPQEPAQAALQPAAPPAAPKPLPQISAKETGGKPKELARLSQYESSVWCRGTDLTVGPDGTIHAVFVEGTIGKPAYVYYRASTDGGKNWSAAENLSDDEKAHDASYPRVLIDSRGRVYAIWKYVTSGESLDGPGGQAAGQLVYRVLEAGKWGKFARFPAKAPHYAWFATLDNRGTVHVIWSQIAEDVIGWKYGGGAYSNIADLVQQTTLDGPVLGRFKGLIVPDPMRTEDQLKALGIAPTYENLAPKHDGIYNLSGYVDSNGVAHFLGERREAKQALWHFDGQKLESVYEYIPYASGNTFENPPALLVDDKGIEHVIRMPEKAEKSAVRDYALTRDGETLAISDPTPVFQAPDAKRRLPYFQVWQKSGRLAVMCEIEGPDVLHSEADLYVSFWDNGKWTTPLSVTDNAARATFFSKDTTAASSVAQSKSYNAKFASIAYDRDGRPNLLMNNVEHTITGITNAVGATASGRIAVATGGFSTESPKVFFLKL